MRFDNSQFIDITGNSVWSKDTYWGGDVEYKDDVPSIMGGGARTNLPTLMKALLVIAAIPQMVI